MSLIFFRYPYLVFFLSCLCYSSNSAFRISTTLLCLFQLQVGTRAAISSTGSSSTLLAVSQPTFFQGVDDPSVDLVGEFGEGHVSSSTSRYTSMSYPP